MPIFFDTESDTFFDTNFFPKPIPILLSIPKIFETDTDTFFDTKIFRNRYRYFFRDQIFFETDTDTIKKHGKVSKPNLKLFRSKFGVQNREKEAKNKKLQYQFLSKQILLSIPIFFETDTDTFPIPIFFKSDSIKINGKVLKQRSFETEMSHSAGIIINIISYLFLSLNRNHQC